MSSKMGSEVSVSNSVNIVTNHITTICKPHAKSYVNTYVASFAAQRMSTRPKARTVSISNDFYGNVKPLNIISKIKSNTLLSFNSDSLPKKLCFICCNSYEGSRYALGDSAINDGLLTYIKIQEHGYEPFIFHDMSKSEFMKILKLFVALPVEKLVVYYIGHGTYTADTSGDEVDGQDECLLMMDGVIIDDDLYKAINKHKHPSSKLILLTDCCHSGTIYDVPDRDDILTVSAASDNETAKQDWIERRGQGVFTYYFWKYFSPSAPLKDLKSRMNSKLRPYSQSIRTNRKNEDITGWL